MGRLTAGALVLTLLALLTGLAPAAAQEPQTLDFTLEHGGLTRSYTLTVPAHYDPAQPAPLLIALHPFGSSGKALRALSGLDALAGQDGFLVAYPDSADLYWDDGRPRPNWFPEPQPIDDLGFLGALIDDLSARYAVAPARVALIGQGTGGTLAYAAACRMPERFAGVAVVGATLWDYHLSTCPAESGPVRLLIVAGAQDASAPLNDPDALTLAEARRVTPVPGVEPRRINLAGTLAFWAARFGCQPVALVGSEQRIVASTGPCPDGGSVTLALLPGVGANWARAGGYALNQTGFDISALATDFLLRERSAEELAVTLSAAQAPASALWGGIPRSYTLYVPRAYDPARAWPVIIALHGRSGNGAGMAYLSRFNELAEREGVIVVYPDGIDREWSYLPGTPGIPAEAGVDDVGFLTRLIADLARDLTLDAQRVYVMGFSNGGFMTQRLACDASDTFAAFGSVAATLYPGFIDRCAGAPPVPIMLIHGTHDAVVRWEGAAIQGQIIALSMPDTAGFWAEHNRCDPEQVVHELVPKADPDASTEVHRLSVGGCAGRGAVLYEVIAGGGHNLPGVVGRLDPAVAGAVNTDINTADELWTFFAAHPLGD